MSSTLSPFGLFVVVVFGLFVAVALGPCIVVIFFPGPGFVVLFGFAVVLDFRVVAFDVLVFCGVISWQSN